VRRLLALNLGDPFDEAAISSLYTSFVRTPRSADTPFGFSPRRDPAASAIDLTLNFSPNSDQPRVIVH
jgi:hypothetical protein